MPAPPNLQWYESNSIDLISDTNKVIWKATPRGSTGLPIDIEKISLALWNDKGSILGSFDAKEIQISVIPTDGDIASEIFTGTAGNAFQPMLQVRSRGASVNIPDDAQTIWTPISYNVFLSIGDMIKDSMRRIELRIAVPLDAASFVNRDFKLAANYTY